MSKEFGDWLTTAMSERRIAVKALAAAVGASGSAVSQWRGGGTEPGRDKLPALAKVLSVSVDDIVRELSASEAEHSAPLVLTRTHKPVSLSPAPDVPHPDTIRGLTLDVPVMGTAVGGKKGDFRLNGEITERVLRPPGLLGVPGLFAVRLMNDSMYPAWREGALLYINSKRHPIIGDDVIVEFLMHDELMEPGDAFCKRLVKRTQERVIVKQFNPPEQLEFDAKAVKLHRVYPYEELLGFS